MNIPSSEVRPGRLIILNGPTRAGKSSLAAELQRTFPKTVLILSMDSFYCHIMVPALADIKREVWPTLNWASALYATSRALVLEGHDLILDTLTVETLDKNHLLEHFEDLDAYLIGLFCPLEILLTRMRDGEETNPKAIKGVEEQFGSVHTNAQNCYDLELDTSKLSTEACAQKILDLISSTSKGKAIFRLREQSKRIEQGACTQPSAAKAPSGE